MVTRPVIFTAGYRVFFPLAALSAVLILGYWVLLVTGGADLFLSNYSRLGWHQHEMIFGVIEAVITGFLFTAVPNWTGKPTPTGLSLALLALLWLLGRGVMFFSSLLPIWLPLIIDGIFFPLVIMAIAYPIICAGNKRNYFLPGILMAFAALNIATHLTVIGFIDWPEKQLFLASVLFIVFLMNVIGGRIIPNFTRGKYPAIEISTPAILLPLSALSIFCLGAAFLLNLNDEIIGGIAVVAGLSTLMRSLSFKGWKVAHDPILFILHLGYFWIPVGCFLVAGSCFTTDIPMSHALHAFTVGAMGSLTLGVMARATLGHSGLALKNEIILTIIFLSITLAAVSRALLPLVIEDHYGVIIQSAASLWILAYGLFLVRFWAVFFQQRKIA